jgi:hypothetical protein
MKVHNAMRSGARGTGTRTFSATLCLAAWGVIGLAAVCFSGGSALAKEKTLTWKPIEDALLRVDDAPLKEWGVYQTGKKTDRLILQMGKRFLLIQFQDKQIFEIDPAKVAHKADDILWNPDDRPAQPLQTSDWANNDIGGAFGISARIDGENHVLDLQLPHPPDVGDLPARSTAPTRRNRY